jgi:hypothetical protein
MAFSDYPLRMDDAPTFADLEQTSLSDLRGTDWDTYYTAMTPWLRDADADIRQSAINRLWIAVLWAEPNTVVQSRNDGVTIPYDKTARIGWLLDSLDAAKASHPDIIPLCLDHLRYENGDGTDDPVTLWLERMLAAPPPGVDPGMIEGTILLRQPFDEDNPADVARLVALLDHPLNYVRACAARRISVAEGDALDATEMFALIKDKEIVRPGIAGPYWSEWQFCREDVPIDPIEWMMEIVERRNGPEPEDMPFNGIDFYLHEICDHSPETVLRMMRGGHFGLAIETATETRGAVPGMEPVLRQLADHADHHIRNRAQFHLAHYYRFLHQEAETRGVIRRWPDWSTDAEVFSFHHGEQRMLWFVVICPRKDSGPFTDAVAWSLIDRALPPELRGEVDFHYLDVLKKPPPAPYRLGDQMMWRFASSANLEMHGDPDGKTWSRIDIGGAHLGSRWDPFGT